MKKPMQISASATAGTISILLLVLEVIGILLIVTGQTPGIAFSVQDLVITLVFAYIALKTLAMKRAMSRSDWLLFVMFLAFVVLSIAFAFIYAILTAATSRTV